MKLCVSQQGNGFSSEDLSLHNYFSCLLLPWGDRYAPCSVRISLPCNSYKYFPFTASFTKNVGGFTVPLQQLCST